MMRTTESIVAWHPGWFVLRQLHRALSKAVERLPQRERARVLDFGCANAPYRALFPASVEYLGADLPGHPWATVTIEADGRTNLADASVDVVLSTQVLEHVAEPAAYLRECHRVLRPGGTLLLTTHGIWVYHRDPVDYWRWTGDGLARQVTASGLEAAELEGIGGLAPAAIQLFQDATRGHLIKPVRQVYVLVLQRLAAVFDLFHSSSSRRANAMVYLVTARKPDSKAVT